LGVVSTEIKTILMPKKKKIKEKKKEKKKKKIADCNSDPLVQGSVSSVLSWVGKCKAGAA